MKSKVTFLVVLLLASLAAASFTKSSVSAQEIRYGARMDQIMFRVIKGPGAATPAMTRGEIDILTDLMRPVDIESLYRSGESILAMHGDQFCYMCFNMRPERTSDPVKILPFGPQSGGNPGLALRHAIAHLVPKDVLIGTLFKYVVTPVDVPMSAALGTFGADIDTHPYDPTMATNILLAAGWTWDGSDWQVPATVPPEYPLPGGSVLPTIEFMSPTLEAAPTSWTIVETTAQNMRDIGIKVDHPEYDLTTMIDMIDTGNFEMFFLCWQDMGRFGDHLYHFFHSANNVQGGANRNGLRNDTLDAVLWELYTTLDKTYMEQKVAEALELLMGTSAYEYTVYTDGIIPYIPIYSRTYYDAYDVNLIGAVNARLKGSWNYWTASNMGWDPGYERASFLVPGGTMAIFRQSEDFQAGDAGGANPAWVSSPVTWDMLGLIYEGLIGMNPYNLKDKPGWLDLTQDPDPTTTPGYTIIPWAVTDGPRAGQTGMKVTFYLDNTVARPWHDGHAFDVYDVAFAWEYLTVNKIPRAWSTFKYFHHCTIEDASTITAYMTTTGITLPYGLSEWSSMFPEHVWGCTHSRDGRATEDCVSGTAHERRNAWNSLVSHINSGAVQGTAGNKLAGDPDATAESGLCLCAVGTQGAGGKLTCSHGSGCVLDDWATPENEILDYDPAHYAHPTAAYPWLTEQLGTGPWVFHGINVAAGSGNLIAFNGADHYPKTLDEIYDMLVEYFWEIGDVDLSGRITVSGDLAIVGSYFFQGVPPAPWRCDLDKNGIVDIRDMTIVALHLGEERARRHTMHVESIDFKQKGKKLDIMVKIYDDTRNPLSGARVYFDLQYPNGTVASWLSADTDTRGIATYVLSLPEKGPYTVTIQHVAYASLSYDHYANVETTDTYTTR